MTADSDVDAVVSADVRYILDQADNELSALAGSHLLLTGGAGFLGYYLLHSLSGWNEVHEESRRIDVTVYDNFLRGIPAWLDRLRRRPEIRIRQHDVVEPVPSGDGPFNHLIHAASVASPTFYRRHPIATMEANVDGLRSVLDHCRSRQSAGEPVRGILFMSSSEIYGDPPPEEIPTAETYRGYVSCTGPRACYDESKRFGETLCVNFAREYGTPVKIARPFNNYGPGLKITDGRVVSDFARQVLAGEDIAMLSDGSPRRTFCYVADAVVGYYKVLVRGRPAEAYNIGVDAPEISIAELAERVRAEARQLMDYGGEVVRVTSEDPEYLIDNPSRRCPDITKARRELDYEPDIPLEEGLRRSLLWYATHPDATVS